MMSKKVVWIMTVIAVGMLWILFHKSQVAAPVQQEAETNTATTTNLPIKLVASNSAMQPNPQTNTNVDLNGTNDMADMAAKYKQGLISKDAVMLAALLEENKKAQDFYGKIVDQYKNPIAGVTVTGELVLNDGTYGGIKTQKFNTQTDENGLFEFTGIYGAGLGVRISKNGYIMGKRGEGYKNPKDEKTSPAERSIYVMWKLQGSEPLIASGIDAHIPHDGTTMVFDIATGKQSPNGDFRVTLSRLPLDVRRGRDKFNWTAKVEMLNGGVIEENDPYPYLVPENGYQPFFEFSVSSNAVPWRPYLDKDFYIKNSQGQYGLMKLHINSSVTPARLKADFTINPSGSRNLEPDFSK